MTAATITDTSIADCLDRLPEQTAQILTAVAEMKAHIHPRSRTYMQEVSAAYRAERLERASA